MRRSDTTSRWVNAWRPFVNDGVFILGSGNVVHNLRLIDWKRADGAFDWGVRFDAEVKRIMTSGGEAPPWDFGTPGLCIGRSDAGALPAAAYLAGLCQPAGEAAEVLIEGGALGSITMTSYLLGCRGLPHPLADHGPAAALPDPDVVPPENTNT